MRLSSWPSSRDLALGLLCLLPEIRALTFQSVPSANLDLSQLGRVAFAGDFDSISLYNYVGQDEDGLNTNGSQSLLARYPTGAFANLVSADSYIQAMCPFNNDDGSLAGIVVGGNFTSIGGNQMQAAALFNPSSSTVSPLPGLTGQVNALYCDNDAHTVYVGGAFTGANSTNAVAWVSGWTNLPFAGFNGPVNAITRLPNGNIAFAGSFTGIGNETMPTVPNAQVVNVARAEITASGTTQNSEYNNPKNVICKTDESTAAGNQWLLADNGPGSWTATFGFGFIPTKLRLYNTIVPGYGTKTWRYTAMPINGIMNFTYNDANGVEQSCTSECPLAQNSSFQDYYFVNPVGMNAFTISISDWYGRGGGLGGIELFQDNIYSFAIDSFNEPVCDGVSKGSNATTTGPWSVTPSGQANSNYLSAYSDHGFSSGSPPSVTFLPDIKQSGNYSITVYTPGCVPDNTCATRGQVNITGNLGTSTGAAATPFSTQLFQTNNYNKYDQVFLGYVEANGDNFRPSVTLVPSSGQKGPLTVVAQSVRFDLVNSTGGLNGLYEYNPNKAAAATADYSNSSIDNAGNQLSSNAEIYALAVANGVTYAAGYFSSESFSNVMGVPQTGNATSLAGGGLNNAVLAMYETGNLLYIGGNFTNTKTGSTSGLLNVASYSVGNQSWQALGAGVNGPVYNIVPLAVNISNQLENCIAVSGFFNQTNAFADNFASAVNEIAVWVPSQSNWLHNLNVAAISLSGRLDTYTTVPSSDILYAGAVDSQELGTTGVAGVSINGNPQLQQLPIKIQPEQSSTSTLARRDASEVQVNGVVTGLFYVQNGLNITVLGGHFQARATNGSAISDLALINNTNSAPQVTGLLANSSSDAAVIALATQNTTLFVGGSISGGLILYDLKAAQLSSTQSPPLSGGNQTVNAIAPRPSSSEVFVGGDFNLAGYLPCPALCIYQTSLQQWLAPQPADMSQSSVISAMQWASPDRLIIAGNLNIGGNQSTMASYDAKRQLFSTFSNSGNPDSVPGPVTAFTATDTSYTSFFAAGTATNGSAFITRFDGQNTWTTVTSLGAGTHIEGIQVLGLTENHAATALLATDQTLLVTGALSIPGYGSASACIYDGTKFIPLVLSTMDDGTPGSVRTMFVENTQNLLNNYDHHLALGFIVLIGLAIALALVFLLVVVGILAERYRRRREGYLPAPTSAIMYEKSKGAIGNIPPERIFEGVAQGEAKAPRI